MKTRPHCGGGERVELVFGHLYELLDGLPVPESHRRLLAVHVEEGRSHAETYSFLPSVDLPLLVHAALAGDERPALSVAAACTLVYLGADLLDNIADDELPERWSSRSTSEASLAATTLLAALPAHALARLEIPTVSSERLRRVRRMFTDALLEMSAGQHDDLLLSACDEVTPAAARSVVERKSGAEVALFAGAAAALATDEPEVVERFSAFGLALGAAGQIASDLTDIWRDGVSRDLLNGRRTLPVVHALASLRGSARRRLRGALAAAREDVGAHDEIREALAAAGSIRYTALAVEVYRQRALCRLGSPSSPAGAAHRALTALVDRVSVFGGAETAAAGAR